MTLGGARLPPIEKLVTPPAIAAFKAAMPATFSANVSLPNPNPVTGTG